MSDVSGQEGRFIGGWGAGQYVGIHNAADNINRRIAQRSSYGWSGGISYLSQEGTFGFRSGLIFSEQGQVYDGVYERPINDSEETLEFESQVTLRYIKLPALVNFRSHFDGEESVNLHVFAGLQGSILTAAEMEVTPGYENTGNSPDLTDLFNNFNYSFVSGAHLNYWFSERSGLFLGVRLDRSISDIEDKSFQFSEDMPTEYYFPVSTKKSSRPAQEDMENRRSSRNMAISLQLGLTFRIDQN